MQWSNASALDLLHAIIKEPDLEGDEMNANVEMNGWEGDEGSERHDRDTRYVMAVTRVKGSDA